MFVNRGLDCSFLLLLFCPLVYCSIESPGNFTVQVDKVVLFQWNLTTTGSYIMEVKWKLGCKESLIYHDILSTIPTISAYVNNSSYKGRVSFIGNLSRGYAWFKLTNLEISDANFYCASIRPSDKAVPTNTKSMYLQVTETPSFKSNAPPATKTVIENETLSVLCSAVGPPTPQVKWFQQNGDIIVGTTKLGNSTLRIARIKRRQSGTYVCEASNNPNEPVKTASVHVVVHYPPEVKKKFIEIFQCIGDKADLTKSVDGNPTPKVMCTHGRKNVAESKFKVEGDDQYGNYTCNATNNHGHVEFVVQLIKKDTSCQTTPAPSATKPTPAPGTADDVHPGIIAGVVLAVILAIIGVIIAIIFWRRRKAYKQDSDTPRNQTVRMNDVQDNEEFYATAQHNRASPPEEQPQVQYAKVDKSKKTKKKIPGEGELIYADLDHEGPENNRPSTLRRPTDSNDQGTLYADIHSAQQEVPRYGNLDNM